MFNLAEKPYIPQKNLLLWICCKCLAWWHRHTYFWPPLRLLEAKHHTATTHLALWDGPNIELKCQSVRSLYGVWPLTASMEVKNKYAYVITQDICNKFIEVKKLWDVWFLGQIVYSKIEHPWIINKMKVLSFFQMNWYFFCQIVYCVSVQQLAQILMESEEIVHTLAYNCGYIRYSVADI